MDKIPYLLIVGEKEVAARLVAVRTCAGVDQGAMPLTAFLERSREEIAQRRL